LRDHLRLQLYRQVEGTCNGRYGYIVAIVAVDHIDSGVVQDSFGSVAFAVRYTAVVLKPYKNETVDAVVATVNKMGFFANVGTLQVFVSNHVIHAPGWLKL
jgi:DNA-directed RNA polymerase II subunit RPB7